MTEITFHFNVRDRAAYACRLLRKASRRHARIAVTADEEMLSMLDRQLWEFEPVEFIPHIRVPVGQGVPTRLRATAGGFAAACAKAGATLGTFLLPNLRADDGTTVMLLLLAVVAGLGMLLTLILRPDRKQMHATPAMA